MRKEQTREGRKRRPRGKRALVQLISARRFDGSPERPTFLEVLLFANLRRPSHAWPNAWKNLAAAPDVLEFDANLQVVVPDRPSDTDEGHVDAVLDLVQERTRFLLDCWVQHSEGASGILSRDITPAAAETQNAAQRVFNLFTAHLQDLFTVVNVGLVYLRRCVHCGSYFVDKDRRTKHCQDKSCRYEAFKVRQQTKNRTRDPQIHRTREKSYRTIRKRRRLNSDLRRIDEKTDLRRSRTKRK